MINVECSESSGTHSKKFTIALWNQQKSQTIPWTSACILRITTYVLLLNIGSIDMESKFAKNGRHISGYTPARLAQLHRQACLDSGD